MSQSFRRNVLGSLLLPEAEEHQVLGGVGAQPAGEERLSNPVTKVKLYKKSPLIAR